MTRISRKDRTDIKFATHGSIPEAVDNVIKLTWLINDEEYDFIVDRATEEELELLVLGVNEPFHKRRRALIMVEGYLAEMNE